MGPSCIYSVSQRKVFDSFFGANVVKYKPIFNFFDSISKRMEWTFIWYQFHSDAIIIIVRILILEKNCTFNSPQIWRTKLFSNYFFKRHKNGVKRPIWGQFYSKAITKVIAFIWHQFHSWLLWWSQNKTGLKSGFFLRFYDPLKIILKIISVASV